MAGFAGGWAVGTTPRARGKLRFARRGRAVVGNNPACAGKTSTLTCRCPQPTEQPRVRGENTAKRAFQPALKGTTPRARGKLTSAGTTNEHQGNSPACAGKHIITCGFVAALLSFHSTSFVTRLHYITSAPDSARATAASNHSRPAAVIVWTGMRTNPERTCVYDSDPISPVAATALNRPPSTL